MRGSLSDPVSRDRRDDESLVNDTFKVSSGHLVATTGVLRWLVRRILEKMADLV